MTDCFVDAPCAPGYVCIMHDRCANLCGETGYLYEPPREVWATISHEEWDQYRILCTGCGGQSSAWREENP